jgi:ketosteroid isomerase-like protein
MQSNAELIQHFYQSFANGAIEDMVNCYEDTATFEDPAFGQLKGEDVRNMCRMLHESSKGQLKVTFHSIQENKDSVSAKWIAEYVFSQTGRKVVNEIEAHFVVKNGKIVQHIDTFNLWKWSRQALGSTGFMIGYTSVFKKALQKKTHHLLRKFVQKREHIIN